MSKVLKCIIIDDEEGAHLVLRHYIKELGQLEIQDSFYNPVQAMEYMYTNAVDLIFLDINMPGLSGLQMLRTLKNPPLVILTTAYKEYALESYEYGVVDYLVKPFDFVRFIKALDNVYSRIITTNIHVVTSSIENSFIVLRVDKDNLKLQYSEINYTQSWGNYVKVFTTEKQYLSSITTTEIEQKLNRKYFIRIHKSYIVSIKNIKKISNAQLELESGIILPIGSTYKRELLEMFNNL